ncbi:MAG: DUF2283 domain-containing protein [Nanoarchaeota archaeon]|nr:DUF2283 domain-containing protein [Nanoarchaeota archaeon]
MARQIKTIDYDYDNDIFYISDDETVKTSLDIGDFILDVSHKDFICGIEIMDASENLGISKENLMNIKNIKMFVNYKTNHVYVLLVILFKKNEKEVNIQIPLTLSLGHKTLIREMLVYN